MRFTASSLLGLCLVVATAGRADELAFAPYPEMVVEASGEAYAEFLPRLEAAIEGSGLMLLLRASASEGAGKRGVTIPGNAVYLVFRNDFAARMLEASVPAGFETPLRLYVTEGADGNATLSYRLPSDVFRPYGSGQLDAMAAELDPIVEKIATTALGR
jgi:uncharacterized protein (DUF302 family)